MNFGNKLDVYEFNEFNTKDEDKEKYDITISKKEIVRLRNSVKYKDKNKLKYVLDEAEVSSSSVKTPDITYAYMNINDTHDIALLKTNNSINYPLIKNEYLIGNKLNTLKSDNFAVVYGHRNKEAILMENIFGVSLSEFLSTASEDDIYCVVLQILFALHRAQSEYQFVHYNLTVENVSIKKYDGVISYKYYGKIVNLKCKHVAIIHNYGMSRMTDNNTFYFNDHPSVRNVEFQSGYDILTLFNSIKEKSDIKLPSVSADSSVRSVIKEIGDRDILSVGELTRDNDWVERIKLDIFSDCDGKIEIYSEIIKEMLDISFAKYDTYSEIINIYKNIEDSNNIIKFCIENICDSEKSLKLLRDIGELKNKMEDMKIFIEKNKEKLIQKDIEIIKNIKLEKCDGKFSDKNGVVVSLKDEKDKYLKTKKYVKRLNEYMEHYNRILLADINIDNKSIYKEYKRKDKCIKFINDYENAYLQYIDNSLRNKIAPDDISELIPILNSNLAPVILKMISKDTKKEEKCKFVGGIKCLTKPSNINKIYPYNNVDVKNEGDYILWKHKNIDNIIQTMNIFINNDKVITGDTDKFKKEVEKLIINKLYNPIELDNILKNKVIINGDHVKRILQLFYPEYTVHQTTTKTGLLDTEISEYENLPVYRMSFNVNKTLNEGKLNYNLNITTSISVPLRYRNGELSEYKRTYNGDVLKYADFNGLQFILH